MSKKDEVYVGIVKWFDIKLGYGFIECDAFEPKQIFAHYSRIVSNETVKSLSAGQFVTFEVAQGKKGLMAVNIREQKIIPTKATVVTNTQ